MEEEAGAAALPEETLQGAAASGEDSPEQPAVDAAQDAGQDAGPDAGPDAGLDAGTEDGPEEGSEDEEAAGAPRALRAGRAQPQAAAAKKPQGSSTIRVEHEKLDHLMNLIGELIINRNRFAMLARTLEVAEASARIQQTAHDLTDTTYAMARISDDLQDTIMKVRMVPVKSVFARFPRLVRDLSRKSGKKVDLILEGEETELDKSVIEVIGDPLVHLIRNSMDHGLEPNAERIAQGKPEIGRVWLRAYHKGHSVAIEVEDDGRGIDPARMRQVGVKKGIVSQAEADALDDRAAIELIFAPGFSGAEKVTDISGRGVGMDVVRSNVKGLKGTVDIQTTVGKGTKFTLLLPLTLAIIDALIVRLGGQTYAIPLDAVSETTKIPAEAVTVVNNRKAVTLRGEVLGVVELGEILDLAVNGTGREILPVVVIHDNQRRLGLVVDHLLERQEIVIKPLGTYLGHQEGLSGATIMGDGSVVLILDPHEIYRMATARHTA
jgi:two-component system chemotaxis sensor kinase CheA